MDAQTEFPILFHKGRTGALHQWQISVSGNTITTVHGQVDGKQQTSPKVATPKNIGRANATTGPEQALLEARAMWVYKRDRKYSETAENAQLPCFLPMLAHPFQKRGKKIQYPVFVQRKYDGFRCLAFKEDGQVTLYFRSGDVFSLPHISAELNAKLPDGTVVDGELYCHGVPFQTIGSWIKKARPESLRIKFHIYDVPEVADRSDMPMSERVAELDNLRLIAWDNIELVPTVLVADEQRIHELHDEFVADGYEGAIIRLPLGKYEYDHRSPSLLKLKEFESQEYRVIGAKPGVGKFIDKAIFTCATEIGIEFDVTPMGDDEMRREFLTNSASYIGRLLTVKFVGRTLDGKPKCASGVGFRIKEDLPR